jgi:hypothetical protein
MPNMNEEMQATIARTEAVECPTCRACPYTPCETKRREPLTVPHAARTRAAFPALKIKG